MCNGKCQGTAKRKCKGTCEGKLKGTFKRKCRGTFKVNQWDEELWFAGIMVISNGGLGLDLDNQSSSEIRITKVLRN